MLALNAHVSRTARKEINPLLHRAGLPTLGSAHTLAVYRATLTKAQKATLAGLMGAKNTPAKKSTGFVKAKIAEASTRKMLLAELAALNVA